MRKITQFITDAFLAGRNTRMANSEVDNGVLYLHGNAIARWRGNDFEITNAGWSSNTTKERLNALPGVSIYQKNYQWFLNGVAWDGSWTLITGNRN